LTKEDQNHFLIDKSLFELAKTYASLKKYNDAIITYDELIIRFPSSSFISRSYLNKGLILYNTEQLIEAKNVLKVVVLRFKNDRIMSQALNTLKEIAIELGEVGVFSEWLKIQKIDSFSEGDLANSAFQAAEKYYFEKKNRQAERQILDFIVRYPDYSNLPTLRYYLADIYFQKKEWDKAIFHYEYIVELSENEYTERSLVNAILAIQNIDETQKLIPLLIRLKNTATNQENKNFANYNLMKAYANIENSSKSILLSKEILKEDDLDTNVRWDALEIYARFSLIQKDSITAFKIFKELENSPDKLLAVEARFFKAFQLSQEGKYELSNGVIAEFSKKYGNTPTWSARSILLMAKNFKKINDYFQSTYLLETVIKNFAQYPQIIEEAKKLLIEVKENASNQNSSDTTNIESND
jgi:tetratricopeptide (TPR) repeat protein